MRIVDLLQKQAIELGISLHSKPEAIDRLISLHEKAGNLADPGTYKEAILAREKTGSTAVGGGIAIPHAKCAAVSRPGLSAITVPGGVDYSAPDGNPADLLFMIAAPEDGDLHLEVLSRLMTLLIDDELQAQLRSAKTADEFLNAIDRKETERFGAEPAQAKPEEKPQGYRILAVTSCPTGIAHTFMAAEALEKAERILETNGLNREKLRDTMVSCIVLEAEYVCSDVVFYEKSNCNARDRRLDKILTSKWTGIPIMLLLLAVVFWITITGANYPSQLLSDFFLWGEGKLNVFFEWMNAPAWLQGALVSGIYSVLTWVIAVMLPPMAIFFPLFTLLEDLGYLPRVAFNLDKYFKKAHACGKQALTMCMGFGCNAAGIVGCRIIDSPRERMIAIITNNFVPCNGRFPPPHKGQIKTAVNQKP